jgi:predicted cupin superfamily sugar epimerase
MPTQRPTAAQIAQVFALDPLPVEGGLYRQTYRSNDQIPAQALPKRYAGDVKPFGTAIFYLLTNQPDSFSEFHRLPTDEIFHFYLGDPLVIHLLFPNGEYRQVTLGQDILNGQLLQYAVPAGVWQGSHVATDGEYALIGTTMAPGYTHADYTQGSRAELEQEYPQAREVIHRLTRA